MSLPIAPSPTKAAGWHTKLRRLALARYLLLPAILLAFLVQGYRIAPGYSGQMNPDGAGYLTVARQYLDGHTADAVNAYWSPLYSWLLVPFLGAGVDPLLSTKLLAVLIGAGAIASVWWLMRNLAVPVEYRVIVALTLFPILFYFGMNVTTPDLLVATMLLLYAASMTRRRFGRKWWDGLLSGALGGLAYLAKAYALPVVGLHLAIVSVAWWVRSPRRKRRRVIIHSLTTILTFALVAGAWSAVLSQKYGYFTTGSTGKFNFAYNGPDWKMPMHRGTLLAVPTESGTSAWDDITVAEYPHWNPLATPRDRDKWEKNRERNENAILKLLQKFTWLLWPIVLLGVWVSGSRLDPSPRRPGAVFVALLLIFPIGYWLLHVEERFLSFLCIGLLVLGAFVAARLTAPLWAWVRVPLRIVLVLAVGWSFLSKPDYNPEKGPWHMSLGRWSIANRWGDGSSYRDRAAQLAGVMPARARFASIGDWSQTLYLAYLLNARYYGEIKPDLPEPSIQADLAKHQVEFLWVWGAKNYRFLKNAPEVTGGKVPKLRIYDLRPREATTRSAGQTP